MKKFLTVLLVIAVMFTFSFGSAFAATNSQAQYLTNLASAEGKALDTLAANYNFAKAKVTYDGDKNDDAGNYKIDGTIWLTQLEALYADEIAAIHATTVTLQTADAYTANGDKTVSELAALYTVKTPDEISAALYSATGKYAIAAAKAQFTLDKDEYIANANGIDTSIYSTTAQETAYPTVTYGVTTVTTKVPKDYADAIIAKLVYDLNAIKLADTVSVADAGTKYTQLKNAFEAVTNYDAEKKVYTIDETVVDILSLAEEKAQGIKDEATAAAALAKLASNVSAESAKDAVLAYNAEQLAAWTALKDAYVAVQTYLINEGICVTASDFPVYTVDKVNGVYKAIETATAYQAAVADMEEVAALATTVKAATTLDGEVAYDAATVDKLLAAAYKAQYLAAKTSATYTKSAETFASAKLAYSTSFAKEHAKAKVADKVDADEMTYDGTAYYALEWAKVEEAIAAFNKAIDEATTTTEIAKAETNLAAALAVAKIAPASTVDALYTAGVCTTNADNAFAAVANYVAALNNGKTEANQITNPFADKADLYKWYAEKDARTAAEVAALYNDLLAEVAKTPTNAEVKAASEAAVAEVKAAITALPTALNATLADVEAAVAAKDAYDDLTAAEQAKLTAEYAKLNALIANLTTLSAKDITDKIDAIKKGGVTLEDVAAIEELEDANKIYKSLTGSDNTDYTTFDTTYSDAIKAAEKQQVIDAIKVIPTNVTAKDADKVKEARKLYDAYVAKYTDYVAGINAATDVTNYTSLLMAEAQLEANADEIAKAYVQDLSIKARSVKTSKGVKITIKADVQELLDAGYTVEYKFYRSTKSNKNFGKPMIVKSTNTYTNTKGVKGTRYYYKAKLVVKNEAGEVVATTPLTQCLYATRVF